MLLKTCIMIVKAITKIINTSISNRKISCMLLTSLLFIVDSRHVCNANKEYAEIHNRTSKVGCKQTNNWLVSKASTQESSNKSISSIFNLLLSRLSNNPSFNIASSNNILFNVMFSSFIDLSESALVKLLRLIESYDKIGFDWLNGFAFEYSRLR